MSELPSFFRNRKTFELNKNVCHKAPFIIQADLECLIEKIEGCKNNTKNSFTTKEGENIPSDFLMSTILSFKSIENKHDVYRGKDCMKNLCEFLREHAMKITKKKKNEVINKRASGII